MKKLLQAIALFAFDWLVAAFTCFATLVFAMVMVHLTSDDTLVAAVSQTSIEAGFRLVIQPVSLQLLLFLSCFLSIVYPLLQKGWI